MKHFTELFNRESSFKPRRFSNEALVEMQQQRWRGNIRELRNTVERLLIMSRGDAVEAQDIRDILRVGDRAAAAAAAAAAPALPMSHAAAASEPAAPAASAAPAAVSVAPAEPPPRPGTLREFKEVSERAFLVEKLREYRLEHLPDRGDARHAAQQPLQEAGTAPDLAGEGRIARDDSGVVRREAQRQVAC